MRQVLYRTFLKLDNEVKAIVRIDPVCRRRMTVPGVGVVTALAFKAAVDDPSRFKSSRTMPAHFGVTPRRNQTGEVDNPGRISKAGDPDVRSALYIAAHALVSRSAAWCALKAWGRATGQESRASPCRGCRHAQTCCHSASHVDRRLRLPLGIIVGDGMIQTAHQH